MTEQIILSRNEAIENGHKFYFTGKFCVKGHIVLRRTSDGSCCDCRKLLNSQYRSRNVEKCKGRIRNHYQNNKEYYKNNAKIWATKNSDKNINSKKKWSHSEVGKLSKYESSARRRAFKLNATPVWLSTKDLLELKIFYSRARYLTITTGVLYHVDHIIPLNGNNVCGLHVPWNLQILKWRDNLIKSNTVQCDD